MKKEQKKRTRRSLFQGTIRGRILLMGIYAIIAALLIGTVGVTSINQNSKNNKIESIVNEISVLQYKNQALEVTYQYYIDATYLNNINNNLSQMDQEALELQKLSSSKYANQVASLIEKLESSTKNYTSLIDFDATRGFNGESGKMKDFYNLTDELKENFKTLITGNEWYEIKWIDAVMQGEVVNVDGKEYIKMTYTGPVPEIGKRDNMGVRLGGTFTFGNSYYINNVRFTNGSDIQEVELEEIKQSAGEGLSSAEFTTFNGQPSIHVVGKFNENNQTWEEASTDFTIKKYEIQNYTTMNYDIYFEPTGEAFGFKYGGSINGYYQFTEKADQLDSLVNSYTKMVVEGKDINELYTEIEELFAEILENIPKYATDSEKIDHAQQLVNAKRDIFEQIKLQDDEILKIKTENTTLFNELEILCTEIRTMANDDMVAVKNGVLAITLVALVLSAIVLALTTLRTSNRINHSVVSFQKSLDAISDGDVSVRVEHKGNDEFSQFGDSINSFMDTLEETIQKLQKAALLLSESGVELDDRANRTKDAADIINCALRDISSGAGEQANDVENSSMQIMQMKETISNIIASVDDLTKLTTDMKVKDDEATTIMLQLSKSNDTTTEAFRKIANQIRKTNDSVEKIQNAVDLIASIASQTNLLSLNASIEAARAGEAGKGFAVVASEIQKLAEQTNSSAGIINNIITSLSVESEQTVRSINELTAVVDEQGENLEETKNRFASVSEGIQCTEKEMQKVRQQANECSKAGESVGSIMVNLSAIAEENAASTEQTTNSMTELNDATISLAETADELRELSNSLNDDLNFFKTK